MGITVFGGTKGGVGKSTYATGYAVWLAQKGEDVVLVDCDHKQQSTGKWQDARQKAKVVPEIPYLPIFGAKAGEAVKLQAELHAHVVVDSPGYDAAEFRSVLVVADQLIAPVRPGYFDVEGMWDLIKVISAVRAHCKDSLTYRFVRNGLPPGTRPDSTHARQMALDIGQLPYFSIIEPLLGHRTTMWEVLKTGRCVLETRAKTHQKAREEFNAIMEAIYLG